ncbi:MAG: peroxiredoxin [bacterium]|nr:peroxiredoxin [bacterium]
MERERNSSSRLLNVGEQAPSFSLPDQNQNVITLDDFQGSKNVVLVFYPRDNTPGCTKQLCGIRDEFELFTKHDTVVFGINPQDAAAHRRFVDRHGLPMRLLVDRDREVVSAYGCRGTLATKRTVYGIDKKGMIVFARRGAPSSEDILRAFREQVIRTAGGLPDSRTAG